MTVRLPRQIKDWDGFERSMRPAIEREIERASRAQLVTLATLPDPATSRGFIIQVTDESGGEIPAFSDGTDWRRVTDRAVVS